MKGDQTTTSTTTENGRGIKYIKKACIHTIITENDQTSKMINQPKNVPYIGNVKKAFAIIWDHAEDFDDDFYMGTCVWKKLIREYRAEVRMNNDFIEEEKFRNAMREMHNDDREMVERAGKWF